MLYKCGLLRACRTSCVFGCLATEVSWSRAGGVNCLVTVGSRQLRVIQTTSKLLLSWKSPWIKSYKENKNPKVPMRQISICMCFPHAPHHEVNFCSDGQHSWRVPFCRIFTVWRSKDVPSPSQSASGEGPTSWLKDKAHRGYSLEPVWGFSIWHKMSMAVRGGGAATVWSWASEKSGNFIAGMMPLHVRLQ